MIYFLHFLVTLTLSAPDPCQEPRSSFVNFSQL